MRQREPEDLQLQVKKGQEGSISPRGSSLKTGAAQALNPTLAGHYRVSSQRREGQAGPVA